MLLLMRLYYNFLLKEAHYCDSYSIHFDLYSSLHYILSLLHFKYLEDFLQLETLLLDSMVLLVQYHREIYCLFDF
jgi:hypothetical protein